MKSIVVFMVFLIMSITILPTSLNAYAQMQTSPAGITSGNPAIAQTITPGQCGELDLVLAIDTTGSMGGAIANVAAGAAAIITQANIADVNTARVGLITFNGDVVVPGTPPTGGDFVTVVHNLNDPQAAVLATLAGLTILAPGGAGLDEASNEAKNTAINELAAGTRADASGFVGTQFGTFSDPWQIVPMTGTTPNTNILVVIADDFPGGFNDVYDAGFDDVQMAALGTTAAAHPGVPIRVSDVMVAPSASAVRDAIFQADAINSGGAFLFTALGADTANAILSIIDNCGVSEEVGGFLEPVNTSALILAGAQMNAAWLIPLVVGMLAFGIVLTRKLKL